MSYVCVACGEKKSCEVNLNDSRTGLKCINCGLIKTNKIYSDINCNKEIYSNIEERIRLYNLRESEFRKRFEFIYKTFNFKRYLTVTEIGSNLGYFSNYLLQKGHIVNSVELNNECRHAQQMLYNLNPVKSIDSISSKNTDLFVSLDVIEHIEDLDLLFGQIHRILKQHAGVYVQLPNSESLIANISKSKWRWWSAPDHVYHFNTYSLTLLMNKYGFSLAKLYTFSPILDDLSSIPYLGFLFKPLWFVNSYLCINKVFKFKKGSLIGALFINQNS